MKPEGEVIQIVTEYELIANIGEKDGVKENHRYQVYTLSDEIEDPESGESLGKIEYTKALVRPTKIKEKMSVMESAETTPSPLQAQLTPFTGSQKKLTDRPNFSYADDEVKEGDLVKFYDEVEEETI